jgi:hypothetical protein
MARRPWTGRARNAGGAHDPRDERTGEIKPPMQPNSSTGEPGDKLHPNRRICCDGECGRPSDDRGGSKIGLGSVGHGGPLGVGRRGDTAPIVLSLAPFWVSPARSNCNRSCNSFRRSWKTLVTVILTLWTGASGRRLDLLLAGQSTHGANELVDLVAPSSGLGAVSAMFSSSGH